MPGANVILVAAAAAGLYLGGLKILHGVKKLEHKIVHAVKHQPGTRNTEGN